MTIGRAPRRVLFEARARLANRQRSDSVVFAVPLVLASAFVLLLVATFSSVVWAIYSDSDGVSLPVIGQLYSSAPNGASAVVGFGGWYTGLWFELLTHRLPFYRQLWEVGPWVASLAAVGLVVWSSARAAGRFAAALVAFVLACAGPILLTLQFEWAKHGGTTATVCVLGAFLVLLVDRGGSIGGRTRHVLLSAAVGAVAAAGAASDELLFVSGVIPFVLAGLVLAWLLPRPVGRRVGATAVGTAAFSFVGALIVNAAMASQHVQPVHLPVKFAPWHQLASNFVNLAESLAALFNGDFGGAAPNGRSLLAFACAVALAAGVVVAARTARGWMREVVRRIATDTRDASPAFGLRAAYLTFWLLVSVFTGAAFVLSSLSTGHSSRYLVPMAYGVVALAASTAAGRGVWHRRAAVLAASVIVCGSVVSLAARDLRPVPGDQSFAKLLLNVAQSEGLHYGYAQYWDAAKLTWELHGRVQIYPIERCNVLRGLCKNPFNYLSSWYEPRPNTRSFLIVDPRYGVDNPGKTFGGTVEQITSGHYTIVVYDYDIASALGPAPPWSGT